MGARPGIESGIVARRLYALIREHRHLPLPGSGETIERFRVLAQVAQEDLSLAKLFESHADALAILSELGEAERIADGSRWAVWCAELQSHRLAFRPDGSGFVRIVGSKAFASGFVLLTHALVSGFGPEGERLLAAIDLRDPSLTPISGGFDSAGMSSTETVDLHFDGVRGTLIGGDAAYLKRPGFTHGAAGVAACWYGGARALMRFAHEIANRRGGPHLNAHLAALDLALEAAANSLRAAAAAIDEHPEDPSQLEVMRARLMTEAAAEAILQRLPRMAGAGMLCRDLSLDRILNDLRIYIRQSHAERDLEAHGLTLSQLEEEALWSL